MRRSSSSRRRSTATRSDPQSVIRACAAGLVATVAAALALEAGAAAGARPPRVVAFFDQPAVRTGFLAEARARGLERDIRVATAAGDAGSALAVVISDGRPALGAHVRRECTFNHGGTPVPGMTQNVLIDDWGAGFSIGKAAGGWIRARRASSATVLLLRDARRSAKERAEGIVAGLQVAAPKARVVQAPAQTSAEGAALARGRAAVVVTTNVAPAIGAAGARGVRFVGSVGVNGRALQMIERGGAFKIAWSFYEVLSGVRLLDDLARCLSGHPVASERTLLGGGVTRGTVAAFRNAVANPLAPGTRRVYAHVMRDCSCAAG